MAPTQAHPPTLETPSPREGLLRAVSHVGDFPSASTTSGTAPPPPAAPTADAEPVIDPRSAPFPFHSHPHPHPPYLLHKTTPSNLPSTTATPPTPSTPAPSAPSKPPSPTGPPSNAASAASPSTAARCARAPTVRLTCCAACRLLFLRRARGRMCAR